MEILQLDCYAVPELPLSRNPLYNCIISLERLEFIFLSVYYNTRYHLFFEFCFHDIWQLNVYMVIVFSNKRIMFVWQSYDSLLCILWIPNSTM